MNGLSPWSKKQPVYPKLEINYDLVYIAVGSANNVVQQNPPSIQALALNMSIARVLIDSHLEDPVYESGDSRVFPMREDICMSSLYFKEFLNSLTERDMLVIVETFTGQQMYDVSVEGLHNINKIQFGLVPLSMSECFPELSIDHGPIFNANMSEFIDISKLSAHAIVDHFLDRMDGRTHHLHVRTMYEYLKSQYRNIWFYEQRRGNTCDADALKEFMCICDVLFVHFTPFRIS